MCVHVHPSHNPYDYDSVTDEQHVRTSRKSKQRRKASVRTCVLFLGGCRKHAPTESPLVASAWCGGNRIVGRAQGVDGAPARQLSSPALQDCQRDEHRVNTVRAHTREDAASACEASNGLRISLACMRAGTNVGDRRKRLLAGQT